MCGIAGIVHRDGQRPVAPEDLGAMAAAMRHRGPDGEGFLTEGSVGFAMRRLAVIDLAGGNQPVWNEDLSIGVVQNGEIYNYKDLRSLLSARGHTFRTSSDTEAIVHLYEERGPSREFPAGLEGMFAVAVFDRARGVIVLARDRAGKKPLFIYRDATLLAFASEIPALFAPRLPFDRTLDAAAIDAYLALQYVPGPGTLFRNVRQLPPGSLLVLERTDAGWREKEERRYWTLPSSPVSQSPSWKSFPAAVNACEALLSEAVRRRLMSDVPLGAFLSGGVDSSLVTALMARHASERVRTFSIGFEDPSLDESSAAKMVARQLDTDHLALRMPAPTADELKAILAGCDQPLGDPAIVPTWYLSRMTREHVTVALSGEGADEVFGGYHWYRPTLRDRLSGFFGAGAGNMRGGPAGDRQFGEGEVGVGLGDAAGAAKSGAVVRAADSQEATSAARRPGAEPEVQTTTFSSGADSTGRHFDPGEGTTADRRDGGERSSADAAARALYARREQMQADQRRALLAGSVREDLATTKADAALASYLDAAGGRDCEPAMVSLQAVDFLTWMADDLLVKVDRMSMAHSLEVRCPYLDRSVVEAVLPGPASWKFRWGHRKALLRAVARRHLPEEIVGRKKHGFQIPVDKLLRKELREILRDLTSQEFLSRQAIFDPAAVAALVARWESDPTLARTVWKLLCFQVWWSSRIGG